MYFITEHHTIGQIVIIITACSELSLYCYRIKHCQFPRELYCFNRKTSKSDIKRYLIEAMQIRVTGFTKRFLRLIELCGVLIRLSFLNYYTHTHTHTHTTHTHTHTRTHTHTHTHTHRRVHTHTHARTHTKYIFKYKIQFIILLMNILS